MAQCKTRRMYCACLIKVVMTPIEKGRKWYARASGNHKILWNFEQVWVIRLNTRPLGRDGQTAKKRYELWWATQSVCQIFYSDHVSTSLFHPVNAYCLLPARLVNHNGFASDLPNLVIGLNVCTYVCIIYIQIRIYRHHGSVHFRERRNVEDHSFFCSNIKVLKYSKCI